LDADLVRKVWLRASHKCEYCHFPAAAALAPFQIDHIIARQHGGSTELDNLALACIHCNRYKGPNLAGIDLSTGNVVRLFHPRRDIWTEHFQWSGPDLKALTAIGHVTVQVLSINDHEMRSFRLALIEEGTFERDPD
jgi:hypothetical protein